MRDECGVGTHGAQKAAANARWACVLPVALAADIATSLFFRALLRIASDSGLGSIASSSLAYWLGLFLSYVPPKIAFVALGAKTAPRLQAAVSIALTMVGIGLSLTKHVFGQLLAGNKIGYVNYSHFGAESAGLLCGMALIVIQSVQVRRTANSKVER